MEATNSFQDGMTAGRGFIGLAAMIVGRWTPDRCVRRGAAVRVVAGDRPLDLVRAAERRAGRHPEAVPPQLFDALPYLVTIIVLAGLIGRSIPPAADGKPYERESVS